MNTEQAVTELHFIEALCDQLKERCCKARMLLAPVEELAPHGGKKGKKEVPMAEVIHIATKRRISLQRNLSKKIKNQ